MAAHMADAGGAFVQAESEVSAINMVYGLRGHRHAGDDVFILSRGQPQTGRYFLSGQRGFAVV